MTEEQPISREEAVLAELERYRERLQYRWAQILANRERINHALNERQAGAQKAAETYLGDLSERAQFRANVRARGEEEKRLQEEILKKQAEVYRQRLRKYLRPDQLEEPVGEEHS